MAQQQDDYKEGLNNKAIAETHPFISVRQALSVAFFEIKENFLKGDGTFKVKSIKEILESHRESIISYFRIFPETKNFKDEDDLHQKIQEWHYDFVGTRTPAPTDDMFINFVMNDILNDINLGYEEADCEDSIGPLSYLLYFIFQIPYSSLKNLEAVKFYESLRGPIENYVSDSDAVVLESQDLTDLL
jgi:hypothetical protein